MLVEEYCVVEISSFFEVDGKYVSFFSEGIEVIDFFVDIISII